LKPTLSKAERVAMSVVIFQSNENEKKKFKEDLKQHHKECDQGVGFWTERFTPMCGAHTLIHKYVSQASLTGDERYGAVKAALAREFEPLPGERIDFLRSSMDGYTDALGFLDFYTKYVTTRDEINEIMAMTPGQVLSEDTKRGWVIRGVTHVELKSYRD
jgi:hypothetical protein